jgi:hypothetical protein
MEVPKHCIEIFTNKFQIYPSFVNIGNLINYNDLSKIKSKSQLLWINKEMKNNEFIDIESFLEYDSKGIMIYIKEGSDVTFLSTSDKIQNIILLLSQLKKIKK